MVENEENWPFSHKTGHWGRKPRTAVAAASRTTISTKVTCSCRTTKRKWLFLPISTKVPLIVSDLQNFKDDTKLIGNCAVCKETSWFLCFSIKYDKNKCNVNMMTNKNTESNTESTYKLFISVIEPSGRTVLLARLNRELSS